jgi:acetyltransferase
MMGRTEMTALFDPKSVAIFGATEKASGVGGRVFANMLDSGFEGTIAPINPKHSELAGRRCFASLAEVGEPIDLAVIATPAATVPGIIKQCGEAGTKAAIVLSAGFGEGGVDDKGLSDELRRAARRAGVRFLGPNCVGLVRPWLGLNATFLRAAPPKGGLALISQSGALCSAIADWAAPHNLGFSALVSLGNSFDMGFGEAMEYLATDRDTHAILLYVEGVRHAPSFFSALRMAAQSKPVLVLKVGRNQQSRLAAQTHTGALVGDDSAFDAALSRAGAVRVRTFGQLFAAAEILAANKRASGNRLGIITNGGGAGVLATDRAGDMAIDAAPPSPALIEALNEVLPPYWSHANPIDILGDAPPEAYGAAVRHSLAGDDFDGLLVMLTPQAMTEATRAAEEVVKAIPKNNRKPVIACWMGETSVAEGRRYLSEHGVPTFTTPERAVEAFSYLAEHHRNRLMALETPGPLFDDGMHDHEGARMLIYSALSDGREMLSDTESKAVLRAFGIPVNTTIVARSEQDALVAAETLGFPVAMKIHSPQIPHKSDVGGVRTGVLNAVDVRRCFTEIMASAAAARPDAELKGVTIESMADVAHARELLLGVTRDPVFGPIIVFGAGGTMVEVLRDSAVSLPPLNDVLARRLIGKTKVSRLLNAFRERPAVDRAAVVDVLLRISDMICELPEIVEMDINPLFAGPDRVVAVDARIKIHRPPAKDGPYDHMAIHPYPRHLVSRERLDDGSQLLIRPIRPEDAESEAAFIRDLSPEAKRFRFMRALNSLTPEMLVRFTQIDYRREMALIAVEEGKTARQIGVARYSINPDNESCEFAIVVSDKNQHQGVGTRLMKALIRSARDHGVARMEGTVLRANRPMLELMQELGFLQSPVADDPEIVHIELPL